MNPLAHFDPDDPYPDSDGEPMADNTEQFDWIVKIKENLEILFADDPGVFVAGDLLWYPVPERQIADPAAPDVMVAIGRPKGRRGSYKQWEEGGIAPQVVFEILSPSNSAQRMAEKLRFYDRFGVEEYYVYDPSTNALEVWLRQDGRLRRMPHIKGWTSPRLGIRFALTDETLEIFYPQGQPFLSPVELDARMRHERERADRERERADRQSELALQERMRAEQERSRADRQSELALQERMRAEQERSRADRQSELALQERMRADQEAERAGLERERAERLAERLRALGIEP